MCYALLTTCTSCTWLLSISYPRCSHAKAYAIDPPACPHRMRRRYKAAGLCSACSHRKDSLSVTPCEVRIAFRDTEIGAVEKGDMVEEERARRRRTRARAKRTRRQSAASSEGDDVYVASSPSASTVSVTDDEEPRKPKPKTLPKPKPKRAPRKRRRSAGVLERIQAQNQTPVPVKKRRGRPPKAQKMIWPDRIDGGVFEQMNLERGGGGGGKKGSVVKPVFVKEGRGHERPLRLSLNTPRACGNGVGGISQERSHVRNAAEVVSVGRSGGEDEEDNLAYIIALEASKREKKWR